MTSSSVHPTLSCEIFSAFKFNFLSLFFQSNPVIHEHVRAPCRRWRSREHLIVFRFVSCGSDEGRLRYLWIHCCQSAGQRSNRLLTNSHSYWTDVFYYLFICSLLKETSKKMQKSFFLTQNIPRCLNFNFVFKWSYKYKNKGCSRLKVRQRNPADIFV